MQYFIKFNFTFCFFFHVASSDFKIRCVAHPILLWSGADPDHSGRVCLRQVRWEAELPVIVPALNALPTPLGRAQPWEPHKSYGCLFWRQLFSVDLQWSLILAHHHYTHTPTHTHSLFLTHTHCFCTLRLVPLICLPISVSIPYS